MNTPIVQKSFGYIYFFVFVICTLLGIAWYFKEKLILFIKGTDSIDEDKRKDDKEKNTISSEKKSEEPNLKDKIYKPADTIKKSTAEKIKDEPIDKMQKGQENKPKMEDSKLSQEYSKSQIVGEKLGYCYVGSDDNIRYCVEAYGGEVCTSGDIYKRMDQCIVPSKQ